MLPMYDTKLFTELYNEADDFLDDWKASGLYKSGLIKDDSVKTIFYLLYAKHGNDPIANYDENQFAYRMWSIIFKYGPSWEKKLDIQESLRGLSESDIQQGSMSMYNRALNPDTIPGTDTNTELPYVNDQTVSKSKKGVLDAYNQLWALLTNDVTTVFIDRFDTLFLKIVSPQRSVIYTTELEDED